jgi:ubiquinol-cytochrome c reductase cytochrome b subunit
MNAFWDWLDHRTGIRSLTSAALYEHIPGGARWRYVWGSTLVFAFTVQVVTGLFLWMSYSPSALTAWESVYYIQYDMAGGWLLRGLHHFTAQAMVVLLAVHLIQVVVDGAYRAPREVNFWIGLILMQIVLGLSLTGYLLPWDQKGYWATQVATKLMGVIPVVGIPMQKLVVGGPTYGHHTLTRFFALHAGILPGLLIFFLVLHIGLFRRHGLHAVRPEGRRDGYFWPDQVLKDAVACLGVLAVIMLMIVWPALTSGGSSAHLGAELGAPADPSQSYSAARPEWYFLFLFQFLKFFHGEQQEFIGAVLVPGAVMGLIFLMPIFGRWKLGHGFNVALLAAIFLGIGALTVMAKLEDRSDDGYKAAVRHAEEQSHRVTELIAGNQGIPPLGAVSLLRQDPKTQGPLLFKTHCGSCHTYVPPEGDGLPAPEAQSAPNLYGYGSREWLTGLLDPEQIIGPNYFGTSVHKDGEMASWVQDNVSTMDDAAKAELAKAVIALSAEAQLPRQRTRDEAEASVVAEGRQLLTQKIGCVDCHKFHDAGELGSAPDLTGWASRQWLIDFISDPTQERFYGDKNDRMPAFAKDPHNPDANRLTPTQLGLIVDFLRQDWYEPSQTVDPAHSELDAENR